MAESGSSGAADCVPVQAGSLKKGSHVVIKGYPCKIVDYSTSKTGKHGHAKANITGVDIFTGRKYEDISPTSHNMMQPIVSRKDFQLVYISDELYLTVMDDKNETREDLSIDQDDPIHAELKKAYEENEDKSFAVTVLKAMGQEKVVAFKEIQP